MTTILEIACRDPIVSRDGRPFGIGQGNRMRGLDWLLPSVVAGSLRSTLGKAANRDFSVATAEDLLHVEVAGAFPRADGQLYFPAPQDCVVYDYDRRPLRAAPPPVNNEKGGCDWPEPGLRPVGLPDTAAENLKPKALPAWWPKERYAAWLVGDAITFDDRFLNAPKKEDRTHVKLDPDIGTAEDGDLFTTAALALTHLPRHNPPVQGNWSSRFALIMLAVRVRAGGWCGETAVRLNALHPLGGERRLAHWKAGEKADDWNCPRSICDALTNAPRVRMVLASPAIFDGGWKPGWLDNELVGSPPGAAVALRLVGVSIERWKAVSGWSLVDLPGRPRGPKPVKRFVPSGGVYFFETVNGKASDLADRWLEPVSDDEQDRRDGFGLAAWGVW